MLLSTACIIAIIGFFVSVQNETVKEKKFLCTHCDYKATVNGRLKSHIKAIHEGQKFPCPHCEYNATFKVNLQTHIKSVHEGQKFQCPHCEHKATGKTHLKKHIKSVHIGQKFPCQKLQQDLKTENLSGDMVIEEYF